MQDERTGEAEAGFDLRLLWLWPLLFLQAVFEAFAGEAHKLKVLRRKTLKAAAGDWAARVEDLHTCEWLVRAMLLQPAERLLSGQEIDLYRTSIPPPPEDWRPSEPRSVAGLIQRFEVLARIQADPCCFIRRLARRLARAQRLAGQRLAEQRLAGQRIFQPSSAPPDVCIIAPVAASASTLIPRSTDERWTLGIRAPP